MKGNICMHRETNICFLILHFGSDELTYNAVKSVQELDDLGNSQIIIVDNGLGFKNIYSDINNIHVVTSDKNIGFSAGNNLGYKYILDNFSPDFVIAMNNDILFPDRKFITELYSIYDETAFYVCGPDVFVPYGAYHSSPLREKPLSIETVDAEILRFKNRLYSFTSRSKVRKYLGYIISNSYLFTKYAEKKSRSDRVDVKGWNHQSENVVFQGSFLIFDKRFISDNEKLFYPETFLYMEEDILATRCIYNGWKTVYTPKLVVHHLVHGSNAYKRIKFHTYCDNVIRKIHIQIETRTTYKNFLLEKHNTERIEE
ncbi:MAG: glycosyltransferase [Firmicutes bacterium]|nr:glycosyltransferase [Bacillota bacterium]MDY6160893.1 glycosyltransferase [Candidatus Faecousia sp.]